MKRIEKKTEIDIKNFPILTQRTKQELADILTDESLSQGETLKRMRELTGTTQKELAEILKVSQTLISLWEKGIKHPDAYMLQWLSVLYGFSVEKFLFQFGYDMPSL